MELFNKLLVRFAVGTVARGEEESPPERLSSEPARTRRRRFDSTITDACIGGVSGGNGGRSGPGSGEPGESG